MRRIWAGACLVLVATACGGGRLTLSEYNEQGTALTVVMEERIATLDAAWESQTPTVEGARTYWDRRLEARAEAGAGLQALDPPHAIAELHETGMDLFDRLVSAEAALAARVASFETVTGPEQWWTTVEAKAVGAVEEEMFAFCQVFQAMYDATAERMSLSDVAWIPSEMKEIVQVDIGCETVRSDH